MLRVAGFVRAFFFALQAIQFEARYRNARVGAVDLFGGAAQIVIERDCFLFPRLLQLAKTFEFGGERASFRFSKRSEFADRAISARFAFGELSAYSRSSRLRTRGPLDCLAAAGEHPAAIGPAIGEQEITVRMRVRHGSGLIAIVRRDSIGEARQRFRVWPVRPLVKLRDRRDAEGPSFKSTG